MRSLEATIKKRLTELGMQGKDLIPLIGVHDQSVLSRIYKRNSARHETLVKIAKALNITVEELTGEAEHKSNVKPVNDFSFVELPYIPVDARAGFISSVLFDTPIILETFTVLITDFKEDLANNFIFEVDGDSMEPNYWAKMKIRVKKVNYNDWDFVPSGAYLILYRKEYLVLKRIKGNEMQLTNEITLYSDNEDTGGKLTVKKSDIQGIWRVLKVVEAPAR